MEKKINSINYMKIVCAFLVVAIHTHPFKDINDLLYYSISNILVKIAVPFFFVSSGYFYIKSECNICKYIKRLLTIYISWSFIYLILQIYNGFILNESIKVILKSFLIEFFIYGSYYHMWYVVALIICIIITSIFFKINKLNELYITSVILYIIGVIGESYYKWGVNIPILASLYKFTFYVQIRRYFLMGLPFFMLGYFICRLNKIPKKINFIIIITVLLFTFEILIIHKFKLQKDLATTFLLYPLVLQLFIVCLKYPMENTTFKTDISKISSFIYFCHPLTIFILKQFIKGETLLYIATCIITTIIAVFILKINNKKVNKLLF